MSAMTYTKVIAEAEADGRKLVDVEREGDRVVLTLGDPQKLNVLSAPLMVQLLAATQEFAVDTTVRSIVITGAGRAFCVGGDLRMMQDTIGRLRDPGDEEGATLPWQWIRHQFGAMARIIARTDKAFIAAINGPAAGVGLAFALACDLAVVAESSILVPAFGRLGLVPEVGTSWALTRALGYRRAFAYYLAGEHLTASRALELGLVNEVVPDADLIDAAMRWCDRVSALPAHVLPIAKPLLRGAADATWEQALSLEEFAEPMCFTTRGFAEGVEQVLAVTSGTQGAGSAEEE